VGASAILSAIFVPVTGLLRRLTKVWQQLAMAHLELAREEASREVDRIVGGAILLAVGATLLLLALCGGHFVAAVLLEGALDSWAGAIGIVCGADVLLGLLLLLTGRSQLKKRGLMEDTRKRVERTVATLKG
jgi:hypothetical protein